MRLIGHIDLTVGEEVDIAVCGLTVRVIHELDGDGGHMVRLGGVDCDLEGEQPGLYYPRPRLDGSVPPDSIECDECGSVLPPDAPGVIGPWHARSCSAFTTDPYLRPVA